MKKIFWVILLALTVCAFSLNFVFAATPLRLVDDANLLTPSERTKLLALLNEISERQEMDIVVVTVDSLGGKTPRAYADDYYDGSGYRADGILLLIAMDSRDYYISTSGYCITALSNSKINSISNRFVGDLSSGKYASAFTTFAELCDDYISDTKSGGVSDRGDTTTPNHSSGQSTTGASDFPLGQNILISLAVGFVIAFIATAVMRSKLKSVRPKSGAADYVKEGSFRLTRSNDFFLYRTVSRVAKPKDNGSHRSSSGRSHGGGGGKF